MRRRFRVRLWYLPLLGIIIGIAYAYGLTTGLIEPWHRIGNPSEKISRIIGTNVWKLLVQVETGDIYSIQLDSGISLYPRLAEWHKEEDLDIETDPVRNYHTSYISPPLLFKVKQLYQQESFCSAESVCQVKFALSESGNVWMWRYNIGGPIFLAFFIFPAYGFVYGIGLVILVNLAWYFGGKQSHR